MLIFTTCPNSIPLKYTFKMIKYKRTILKYINLLENIYMIFFLKNINKLQILIIYFTHKGSLIVTKVWRLNELCNGKNKKSDLLVNISTPLNLLQINFLDFLSLLQIIFCWRQNPKILNICNPSLGTCEVPHKIWARSAQPFWRLLDTRQAKDIYKLNLWYQYQNLMIICI